MDKKSSKYTQPSANKGAAAESKKNQDITNGKLFPKTSRRRESPGNNGCSKNEQSKKLGLHNKTRNFDKRPKPKGQYHGGTKENTKVEDNDMAELGSVMVPGSKKQNLNHLLNFHYEPREVQGGSGDWSHGRSSKNYNNSNRWLPPVQRHKYNKELFLQANCQFVVNIDGDYSRYLIDPDTLVDWKLIEQIKVDTSESLSCPICLGSPVAARMTRCGHVFCWPCILHYLSLSDKSWRKCPICFESIHKSDLKSVIEITRKPMNIGDDVNLRLMRRKRGSLLAVPVGETETPDPETFFQVSEHPSSQIYSKLLLANATNIMEIIELERVQLKMELIDDPHSPENCFIEQALIELTAREECALKQSGQKLELQTPKKNKDILSTEFDFSKDQKKSETSIEEKNLATNSQGNQKFFYFYQSDDGQHVYLHAMNVKMLELQYGDLEHCPRIISGKILEKESGSFTEDLRKRLRYLCHLPLTCSFEIAEIELKTPLISNEVLGLFQEQLALREKRRRHRDREEKKREKKITAEENKWMGKYPTPNVHIESRKHFPQWQPGSPSASVSIPTPSGSLTPSSIASSPSRNSFDDDSTSLRDFATGTPLQNDSGPSFAQMLQNKDSRRESTSQRAWPSVGSSNQKSPVSGVSGNATWVVNNRPIAGSSTDLDDYASVPTYNPSFGDVLAQALEQTELLDSSHGHVDAGSRKTKKKKRGKATVLFATGMTRAS
ncbi:hypothetical protein PV327_010464 [Microctonus hyperodae]|uniref:E3 ubiquitin-protein ligase RNF10 n=1 Tax=Microctonus hyperodae TaxID=165561 RepID=A0AA39FRZ1_MICHY|nr:hypothetical protein PV327_010464 [Microctonus hyperodae]